MTELIDATISYARQDVRIATSLCTAMIDIGLTVWADFNDLAPGDNFAEVIGQALARTTSMVVIVTEESAKNSFVLREIEIASATGRSVIPVVFGDDSLMPPQLKHISFVSVDPLYPDFTMAAQKIAAALGWTVTSQASTEIVQALADELAEEAASTGGTLSSRDSEQTSAFVVHGHDDGALTEVTTYLQHLGVRPIVLKDIEEAEESLLNRFFLVGGEARFAVVIVSPDDRGASRHQYDDPGVGERAMKFRARQNVILELGFFYGKLGFQNVFVLLQEPKEKWPDFELPSDLGGAVFKRIDAQGKWKKLLRKTLAGRGFELN